LDAAAPLKPPPEPVDLDQYRVRRQTRAGGTTNEYRLVAWRGRGFRHAQSVRRDDRAISRRGCVHHGAVTLDRADPRHRYLLLRLAQLAVRLEARVIGLHGEQVRPAVTSDLIRPSNPTS